MPYDRKSEMPKNVKDNLPSHAQDIYRKAFNSAWEHYKNKEDRQGDKTREETAHSVAWAAVKQEYTKHGDKWVKKKAA